MTASGGVEVLQVDEIYEFRAPRFFDFSNEESEEDVRKAELWFETSLSYDPSRTFLVPQLTYLMIVNGFVWISAVLVKVLMAIMKV